MIYLDKGYIGFFEMAEKADRADKNAGKRQLNGYVRQLREAGHKRIIAPINGDIWHQYRLVSWTNGDAPFPLEPQNPLWYNDVYLECGFKPLKKYISDKTSIENFRLDSLRPLTGGGLSVRGFGENDLKLIYELSLLGFAGSFLYSSITFEEFSKLYQPFLPKLDKELALIAEVDGKAAGFVFSFLTGDSLVIKTVAVLPEYKSFRSIGVRLVGHAMAAGQRKGAKTVIGALMAEGNNSLKIASKHGGECFREYTLYCLEV